MILQRNFFNKQGTHAQKKQKSLKKLFFTLALFILTSLITASVFPEGISLAETPQNQTSASEEALLILPSQLLSPSPVIKEFNDFALLDSLKNLSASSTATATTSAEMQPERPDYCLDVPVLLYHHIQPLEMAQLLGHEALTVDSNIFDAQMKYLKDNGYTAISAGELVTALITEQPLPEKTILITIDDGYDDNYTYGFLTAKKYQMVMNFMIPTALIGNSGYMTWDHLKDMQLNKYARIYNHTATHAALGLLTREQIQTELATSTAAFKENLGQDVRIFTYPYGSYNDLAIEVLKEQGFKAAFTTDDGRHQCKSTLMQLQRYHVGNVPLDYYGF